MPITLRILLGVYSQNSNPHNPSAAFDSGLQIDAVMPTGHPLRRAQHLARVYETDPDNWAQTIEERLNTLDYAVFINCDAKGGHRLYSHKWPDKLLRFLPLDPTSQAAKTCTRAEQKAWCRANSIPWSKKDTSQIAGSAIFLVQSKTIQAWFATKNGITLQTGAAVTCQEATDKKILELGSQIVSKCQVEGIVGFEYTSLATGEIAVTRLYITGIPPIMQLGKHFGINMGEALGNVARRKKDTSTQDFLKPQTDQELVLVPEIIEYLGTFGWKATKAIISKCKIVEINGDRLLFTRQIGKAVIAAAKMWLAQVIQKCINKFR